MKKGQINVGYKGRRIAFDGSTKLVGQADRYSTIDYKAITAYAAKAAAVPESSIEMAMEALFDAMNYFVLNGHSVQIPYLGTFSIGIRAKSSMSEAEFTADFSKNLKGVGIRFLPDAELKSMIGTTAINTSVDTEGYDSEGVIAVNSALMGYYTQLLSINEGRPYLAGNVTRIVFNGTRLNSEYVGSYPVKITFLNEAGVESSSNYGGQYLSQSYNTLNVNVKRICEVDPAKANCVIKKVEVTDAQGNTIKSIVLGGFPENEGGCGISAVVVGGKAVPVNGTVKFEAGKEQTIKLYGLHLDSAEAIKIGGVAVEPVSINETQATLKFTPQNSGNYPISLDWDGATVDTYNMSFGDATGLSISSITANGDPLHNGSTTNITAGSNYQIRIEGTGLTGLEVSEIQVPAGTTVAFTSKSDTLIQATLSNAQAGDLKIVDDGVQIFVAALVAVVPGVTVTGWKGSADGATQSLSTSVTANTETGAFSAILVGNDVDDLALSDFTGSTGISGLAYDAATATISGTAAQSGTITIKSDNTTIGTLRINKPSAGGNDDDDDGLDKG